MHLQRNENGKKYNTPLYKHIREKNLNFDEDNFIVLDEVENITETQARMIEERYRKEAVILGGNLNAQRAYVTEEEKKEEKKEYNREYNREYYENNKAKILERQAQKYKCECGSNIRKSDKAQHERTQKHIEFISKTT